MPAFFSMPARDRALWAAVLVLPLALAAWRAPFLGDPVIDFGHELYVSWRLAEGEVLYRDLGYYFGPLSPYLNALLFRLFGAAKSTLVLANLAVWLATLALLGALLRPHVRPRAVALALLAASLLAFNHLRIVPNYNVLTPYRHGLTHGFALALLALLLLTNPRAKGALFGAGLALGLVTLAKIELALAAGLAVVPLLMVQASKQGAGRIGLFAGGLLSTWLGALFVGMAAHGLTVSESAGWLLSPYVLAGNTEVRKLAIYGATLERLGLAQAAAIGAALAALVAGAFALRALLRKAERSAPGRGPRVLVWAAGAGCALLLAFFPAGAERVALVFLAAPWVALAAAAVALARFARGRDPAVASLASLLVLAGAMSLKVAARLSLADAGFLLGLPAILALFLLLFEEAPRRLRLTAKLTGPWRAVIFTAFFLPLLACQRVTLATHEKMPAELSLPRGNVRYPSFTAAAFEELFRFIGGLGPPPAAITFLPEGAGLNFLLGSRNPVYFMSYLPDHYLQHGEEAMRRGLEAGAPSLIVLLPRSTAEFGEAYGEFSTGYGRQTYAWIRSAYEQVPGFPPRLERLGFEVWRRREPGVRNSSQRSSP